MIENICISVFTPKSVSNICTKKAKTKIHIAYNIFLGVDSTPSSEVGK